MTQRKPLKPTDIKVIEGKVAGKKQRTIARETFPELTPGSANGKVTTILKNPNVQEELAKAFERHGITIDRATKPIADGLGADQEYYDKKGKMHTKADHTTRLKASGMAFNLMGMGKRDDSGGQTINNFIIISQEDKDAFDL